MNEQEMETKPENITRGQELYIRHLFLFGKAVPLTVKAAVKKLVEIKGQSLSAILTDKKEHIKTFYNDLYKVLFEESVEDIDEQIESWDITTLCNVVLVLTEQPSVDYIRCIMDQRRDLENYAKTASLDYQTFQINYNALKKSLLELFKDTDVAFDCKRLIYSFDESKASHISNEVYESLKQTGDVEKHIEIVADNVSASDLNANTETEEEITRPNDITEAVGEEAVQFVHRLSDTIIRAGESSVLVCELNSDDCRVVWSKNGETLSITKTVYPLVDKGRQCLVFSEAMPEESGTYTCTYKDQSTAASVIILERDVTIQVPLHNNCTGDIREYMNVELSCSINLPGKTPRWFHNNHEIEGNNPKITIMSRENEHMLIINCVESNSNGEYMVAFDGVTSKTSITVKGDMDPTVKQQLKEIFYKNWMKGVLALKYLKLGLETPATEAVENHHRQILKDLSKPLTNERCSDCHAENLLPFHGKKRCPRTQGKHKCLCSKAPHTRRQCPSKGLCSEIYDMIVRDHRFEDPAMRNVRLDLWKTDPWSIAACYMSNTESFHPSVYKYKTSSRELDCAELLSLFINNKTYLTNINYSVLDMARRHRNELLHNPNYEISDAKFHEYLNDFREVLELKTYSNQMIFSKHEKVKQSLKALDELQNCDILIYTEEELEKMKKEVRDAAMDEAADKLEAGINQKDEEFRQIREEIKSDDSNAIEKVCGKHNGTEHSWYCMDHGVLICNSCMENEHRLCFGLAKLKNRYTEDKQVSVLYRDTPQVRRTVTRICLIL